MSAEGQCPESTEHLPWPCQFLMRAHEGRGVSSSATSSRNLRASRTAKTRRLSRTLKRRAHETSTLPLTSWTSAAHLGGCARTGRKCTQGFPKLCADSTPASPPVRPLTLSGGGSLPCRGSRPTPRRRASKRCRTFCRPGELSETGRTLPSQWSRQWSRRKKESALSPPLPAS